MGWVVYTLPGANHLSLTDFIATLFFHIDEAMTDVPKDPRARLWPSELVTIGVLYVLKAQSQRRFWQWLQANCLPFFPALPERSRLFRLIRVHQDWADRFLAEPGMLVVSDSLGIELIHPRRQGGSEGQVGEKGKSNGQWFVGRFVAIQMEKPDFDTGDFANIIPDMSAIVFAMPSIIELKHSFREMQAHRS